MLKIRQKKIKNLAQQEHHSTNKDVVIEKPQEEKYINVCNKAVVVDQPQEQMAHLDTYITLKDYLLTVLDTQKRVISRLDKLENKISKITNKIMPDLTLEIAN